MTPPDVKNRLKVIYSLIAQDDYLSALRMSYETLLGIASYETNIKGSNYENLNKFEVVDLLFRFLSGSNFKDINYMFEDLCILSIYYENQNRHSIMDPRN